MHPPEDKSRTPRPVDQNVKSDTSTERGGAKIGGGGRPPRAPGSRKEDWIAQGRFDKRVDETIVKDEVGRMKMVLKYMLDRLQREVEAKRCFASDA